MALFDKQRNKILLLCEKTIEERGKRYNNLKCAKCGEEWTTPPGMSVNFCPNCGVPTPTQATPALSTDNVIKLLVTMDRRKDGLFLEPSILLSLASDKLRDSNPELLKHIGFAIFERVPQELYALKSADEQERLIKMNVILDSLMRSFNERTSYEIVNLFAEALGFSLLKTETDRKHIRSEKALTQNDVSDNSAVQVKSTQGNGSGRNSKIGELYYFAGRDWRILDVQNGKALILSEKIIESRAYNEQYTNTTWAECTLQSYLNESYYNLFGQEKFRIANTKIVTPNNPWYGTDGGSEILLYGGISILTDKKSDLLIVTKTKELCSYIMTVTQKSPKQFRFTFVSRLQNLALDVIENIYYANEIFIGKGNKRNAFCSNNMSK